jgi:hypothetical protein
MIARSIAHATFGIGIYAIAVVGCSPSTEASASPPSAEAAQAATGEGPCGLLTNDEVRRVFPDARNGTLDRRNEKHGILNCEWAHRGGRFIIIAGEEYQSPAEEARGWVDSFVDPTNGSAPNRVRFETIAGVGDAAVAVVERADKAKGFVQNGAYIVVRRGPRQVMLASPDLAMRERPAAIAALTELGRAAAGRLR